MKATKSRRLKDPEHQKKPSLRISHVVYGREARGNRVYYLVDPKGGGTEKKVAESIVLQRWRRRVFPGHTFSGSRLNPKIWRICPKVFGDDPERWVSLSVQDIESQVEKKRDLLREAHETLPPANVLRALFDVCGAGRLNALASRHNAPDREERYGTPDLFLYATENATGKASIARFVEVKKPEEPLKPDQREEIAFLQSLGLHARVLRLEERS